MIESGSHLELEQAPLSSKEDLSFTGQEANQALSGDSHIFQNVIRCMMCHPTPPVPPSSANLADVLEPVVSSCVVTINWDVESMIEVATWLQTKFKEWHLKLMFQTPDFLARVLTDSGAFGMVGLDPVVTFAQEIQCLGEVDWTITKSIRVVKIYLQPKTVQQVEKMMNKMCVVAGSGVPSRSTDYIVQVGQTIDLSTIEGDGICPYVPKDTFVRFICSDPARDGGLVRAEFICSEKSTVIGSVMYGLFSEQQLNALNEEARKFSDDVSIKLGAVLYRGLAATAFPTEVIAGHEAHSIAAHISEDNMALSSSYKELHYISFGIDQDEDRTHIRGGDFIFGSHGALIEMRNNMAWSWKAQMLAHCTARLTSDMGFPRYE
ncbi:hypothetical protein HDU93_009789 [Gonapodya sp. JEL0774]|nr:hypothetical protein HDU93_009789 [Gonapodya sp. JEL0774]